MNGLKQIKTIFKSPFLIRQIRVLFLTPLQKGHFHHREHKDHKEKKTFPSVISVISVVEKLFAGSHFLLRFHFQKVCQHLFAVLGEDTFRVKLDAVDGQGLVAQAHHLPFRGEGGDLQHVGQGLLHDQAVIAGGVEGAGQPFEETAPLVMHRADLAVHQPGRPIHHAAEDVADALLAQADSQHGRGLARDPESHRC